jgi:hypothetical protein
LLVKFAATTLTFPLSLRLERVLMRRCGVEDAELLDDTNPEGDAKEEAISSYSSLSPVKCVWRVCVIKLNEENEEEKVCKTRRVKF